MVHVQSLVRELRSLKPLDTAKQNKTKTTKNLRPGKVVWKLGSEFTLIECIVVNIGKVSSVVLKQGVDAPLLTHKESNLSLFPVDRNSKISIAVQPREEAAPAQIKIRDHIFLILQVKETLTSRPENSLEVKRAIMLNLPISFFGKIHPDRDSCAHIGGYWEARNRDSEPGIMKWLAKGNPEEMPHISDSNYYEVATLSPPMYLSRWLYSFSS